MPVTDFQYAVLKVLAKNRSPESHFAGGMVMHIQADSARYSHDFDIFHEAALQVERASNADVRSLQAAGYSVKYLAGDWHRTSTFRKAEVALGGESVEIDWAADSAFRFFPIEADPALGWRLHLFDMATNKALALAARTETRDYIDIVELGAVYPLAAIVWAACGKDPGFSPLFLLQTMRRFARIDPTNLDMIRARPASAQQLKQQWIQMADAAEHAILELADEKPELPIGVAFVDQAGTPGWIGSNPSLRIHAPSVGGCLPIVDHQEAPIQRSS
jgi:hypothetical protein